MIKLTIFQAFINSFSNIFEIIIIYRLMISSPVGKSILHDILWSLIIISIPLITIGSINLVFLVIYLFLFDQIRSNKNKVMDSILAMFTAVIMSSLFDLVDHYTHTLLLQKKSDLSLWGWLIPLNDFLTTLLIGILVVKIIRPRISWLMTSLSRPTWLWRITAILFMLYIWLTAIMEKNGIANRYASMLLIVYFIIIIVSAIGFIDFMRTSKRAQQQQQIIDKYQAQITNANQMNQQYNEIRRERHDLRNMLLSIQGYIRDHKDKEAEKLLSTFLQNDTTEKHYDEVDLALDKIKISGLHNLIKEKAYKIVEKGIPFSFEVNAEIDKLPGSEIKTARIIGILMDNAIEATFKQTKPYIQFALLKHSPKVYELVIANSIEQKLNINTALKFEHSTKEGHQGIGLSNVTQLVENDDHYSFSAEVKDKVVMMTCFIQRK